MDHGSRELYGCRRETNGAGYVERVLTGKKWCRDGGFQQFDNARLFQLDTFRRKVRPGSHGH